MTTRANLICARLFLALTWTAFTFIVPTLSARDEPPQPANESAFRESLDVRVVNVDVRVSDAEGRTVTGLTAEDFELSDDGKEVELTHFAGPAVDADSGASPAGPRLVLFLDDAELEPGERKTLFEHLQSGLDALLATAGEVMLVRQGDQVRVEKPFTSSRDQLSGALHRLAGEPAALGVAGLRRRDALLNEIRRAEGLPRLMNPGGEKIRRTDVESEARAMLAVIREFSRERRAASSRDLSALSSFVSGLAGLEGRKVVLYVGHGIESRPGERLFYAWLEKYGGSRVAQRTGTVDMESTKYRLSAEVDELLALARDSGIAFYTIGPFESSALLEAAPSAGTLVSKPEYVRAFSDLAGQETLRRLAEQTTGRFFPSLDALGEAVAEIGRDERGVYWLGYPSPHRGTSEGAAHQISVSIPARKDLALAYNPTYRDTSSEQRLRERATAALLFGLSDNPLGIEVDLLTGEASGDGSVAATAEIRVPMAKLVFVPDGKVHRGELSAFVLTQDEAGQVSSAVKVTAPVEVPNDRLIAAMGQFGVLKAQLRLGAADRRFAVAVRDGIGDVEAALVYRTDLLAGVP